ncbi:MAG: 3-phosphoshikimate 1-carboxyvinyltransferase [Bacteroidota bacterium]
MDKILHPARHLRGEITVPGDKSISHRAVMIGSLSEGTTEVVGFLNAADPRSTLECIQAMGIETAMTPTSLHIVGKGLHGYRQPKAPLNAGNSGTTIRLLSGILSGQKFSTQISGDQYLVRRPMKRIIDPLTEMGANIVGTDKFTAPLKIFPSEKLHGITYELPVPSAQVKSAVLFAGLFAEGMTTVEESQGSRDHTERMLGLTSTRTNDKMSVSVVGGKQIPAKQFFIPGDPSSAAFFVVAGLVAQNSEILIKNVGINPTRTGFLDVLRSMGGNISIENERHIGGEPIGDIAVKSSALRSNLTLEGSIIPNIIDEIPILAVAGAFAVGTFEVRGAFELRNKESDRIGAVCENLSLMGLEVEEREDGFAFDSKNRLIPSSFDSFGDHRIAMAFGVAAASLQGESTLKDSGCVDISFPAFWDTLHTLAN